jgi:hypothetical protein
LLLVTLVVRARAGEIASGPGYLLAASVALFVAFELPAGIYGGGRELYLSHALTVLVAAVIALCAVFRYPLSPLLVGGAIVVMSVAGVALVLSSPKPSIDVWYMLQAATHALSHGHNIYTARWTTSLPGEASNVFTYLPGAAVLLWPFHALFGDVRYGLVAAPALVSLILLRIRPPTPSATLSPLYLLYPLALFGLEQSWIDPLLLLAFAAMGYFVVRGHSGLAIVALAVALTCKQQAWLAIPLAVAWKGFGWHRTLLAASGAAAFMLPWFVANPHMFMLGAFSYALHRPSPLYSLSFYTAFLLHGRTPGLALPVIATIAVLTFASWRAPRSPYGFLLSFSAVIAVFDLTNRLSFYNEWQLAAGLGMLALAFGQLESATPVAPIADLPTTIDVDLTAFDAVALPLVHSP